MIGKLLMEQEDSFYHYQISNPLQKKLRCQYRFAPILPEISNREAVIDITNSHKNNTKKTFAIIVLCSSDFLAYNTNVFPINAYYCVRHVPIFFQFLGDLELFPVSG